MARRNRLSKAEKQNLVLRHAEHLISLAEEVYDSDPSLAHGYAEEIVKSALRVNLRLPSRIKRRICRKCRHFLMPGRNARVRTSQGHVVSTCLDCGHISRFGYTREQKEKRSPGRAQEEAGKEAGKN
ncbi:ribonuclease P [Candidatus Woesearchaeota archaeon]|nr:MAG: ribonuclease P [Candidatus Woesearchaeota archaeon]